MPVTRHIARTLTELGRIRAGDQQPNKSGKGTHPSALTKWRLTSKSRAILEDAARLPGIGGTVRPWEGPQVQGQQWELYTETDTLDICLPTFRAVTINFEQWSAGGCQVRCDGSTVLVCPQRPEMVGQPCQCPEDDQERADLAKDEKACFRILRVNVMLPDLPGLGFWRMETKGFYATAELLGMLELLRQAGAESTLLEATLRLEAREIKRPGAGTLHFVVPVLTPTYTFRQIAQATRTQQGFLMHIPDPMGELPAAPKAAQIAERVYGEGSGEVFRGSPGRETPTMYSPSTDQAATITADPVPDTPPPAATPQGPAQAGSLHLQAIDDLHLAAGHDSNWVQQYWSRVCRERNVQVRTQLPLATIVDLHSKVKAYYHRQDPPTTSPPAEVPPASAAQQEQVELLMGPEPWRHSLEGLLAYCTDATLAQEARSMLEDPDAPVSMGEAMMRRVQTVVQQAMEEGGTHA